ncbi:unnamed protein product [Caenorhabditis auriculariae]|uniref:ShKT domain-containing protein n=1 Tax=Caenorhabditis auriculariae TaxID=2777116 RepID=A0A8S1I0G3_9PELO|nr:unnamed protein product [Caenorhabditis auriculariae]
MACFQRDVVVSECCPSSLEYTLAQDASINIVAAISDFTSGSAMLQLLFVAFFLAAVGAQSTTTCNIATGAKINGICPSGLVEISDGTCCPQTNVQTAPPCVDKLNPKTGVSDCPKNAGLCTNTAYLDLMKDQCPKTCGFCTVSGSTCADKITPSTCTKNLNLCTNSIYLDLMKEQCSKSCGFCT